MDITTYETQTTASNAEPNTDKNVTTQPPDRRNSREAPPQPRITEIIPGLLLGNEPASHNRDLLRDYHVDAIVSLTDAPCVWWNSTTRESGIPEYRHKWVQCMDSPTQDLLFHLSDICDFIDRMASPVLRWSSALPAPGRRDSGFGPPPANGVLIHCDLGVSRSPAIVIAYLMRKYGATREEVLAFVQSRQKVHPTNFIRQLDIWEVGYELWENRERTIPKAPYREFLDDRITFLRKRGIPDAPDLAAFEQS